MEIDVETRWNSTYLMLKSALQVCRDLSVWDTEYKLLVTKEEWERGEHICECLKTFMRLQSGSLVSNSQFLF